MRRAIARTASYEDTDKDDFPTPPWVTRAFFEYVTPELLLNKDISIYDPACGCGHMLYACKTLEFRFLRGSDINRYLRLKKLKLGDYEDIGTYDYLDVPLLPPYDLFMTNPPFKLANSFVERMLQEARTGVALLACTNWVEGGREHKRSRWARILRDDPPDRIAVISGRMPAAHGKVVQHRPVFVSHSWFYWRSWKQNRRPATEFRWIPPEAQRLLERKGDYD